MVRKMPMIWADDLFAKSSNPCAVCGRPLREGVRRYEVHVIDGGANVLHPGDEGDYTEDAGEMGWHEVGPECRKRFGEFATTAKGNLT